MRQQRTVRPISAVLRGKEERTRGNERRADGSVRVPDTSPGRRAEFALSNQLVRLCAQQYACGY